RSPRRRKTQGKVCQDGLLRNKDGASRQQVEGQNNATDNAKSEDRLKPYLTSYLDRLTPDPTVAILNRNGIKIW
nr:hypothetical protein [Prochloraceae cyanobacterium]